MKHSGPNKIALTLALSSAAFLAGCDGSSSKSPSGTGTGGGARLLTFEYGRLVDVYAFRRVDPTLADRRNTYNRSPVLVARDVVIDSTIQTEELFDAVGQENPDARYRFMPFDVAIGHEELLILWDDTAAGERDRFQSAMSDAQSRLQEVPASYRNQNTAARPIPVVPRNAALRLTFDRNLNLSAAFFQANPDSVQLLEFESDPAVTPAQFAFRRIPHRVIPAGSALVLDTSIIGREGPPGQTSAGMPPSLDNSTANIRIAFPTEGLSSRAFAVEPDPVAQLNDVDANGNAAVIRDFRSGNARDGQAGALSDTVLPAIIRDAGMGIVAIDQASRVLTLNKRFAQFAVRGRVPFVDGGILAQNGLPGGPAQLPTPEPLRSGDFILQEVVLPSSEVVRVRAEIVANEDVGTVVGAPGFAGLGLTEAGDDGGEASIVRVRVASLEGGVDSQGNPVSFQANSLPLGADCTVRVGYYQHIPYRNGLAVVSDEARLKQFMVFDPPPPPLDPSRIPIPPGTRISPLAAVALRFSEPMDTSVISSLDNFLLANEFFSAGTGVTVEQLLAQPKASSLSMLATRLVDQEGDATVMRLVPPGGLFHLRGETEIYWFHMIAGPGGPVDLAGNAIDVYDRRLTASPMVSVDFSLDQDAEDNLIANRVYRFAALDEDGTLPGSEDMYGQFQLENGELGGAPTQRISATADNTNLGTIFRFDKGECWDVGDPTPVPPIPPSTVAPLAPLGRLFMCASAINVTQAPPPIFTPPPPPTLFGGILNPHNPRGSRLQMTYREDDLGLSYNDPTTMMLDLEQLHWAPWAPEPEQFDAFDRVTIDASHADSRPDLHFMLDTTVMRPFPCILNCESLFSGLQTTFAANVLQGSQAVNLVKDGLYQADPNAAFQAASGVTFVPYAKFQHTYTWRDSRLVTWDQSTERAVGLGGAKQPEGVFPARDWTADISSPWIPEGADPADPSAEPVTLPSGFGGTIWTVSDGDFRGDRQRDHDPIALPLLLDFKVYPDDPSNGVARGSNKFHIGHVGPCFNFAGAPPNGYFNATAEPTCQVDYPNMRVHTSGGIDGFGAEVFVDPGNVQTAIGGWIIDAGAASLPGGDATTGRYQTKPGDGHIYYAQADFVRKVSMATFGFFDTQVPNQHNLDSAALGVAWAGLASKRGLPDFENLPGAAQGNYGVTDLLVVTDPPSTQLPGGTTVTVELRGADTFERGSGPNPSTYIYDKVTNDHFQFRGNLLNPNYSCEAYRYASANSKLGSTQSGMGPPTWVPGSAGTSPRVQATGLSPYVQEDNLEQLRDTAGFLPRFINMRIVFENNIVTTPPVSPSLRSVAIVYRMARR